MARLCMRPGCDRPAAARLAYDPVALQLWLDPLGPRSTPVQELCEFHVDRLTIPRGWSAMDRRPGPTVVGIDTTTEPAPFEPVAEPVVEPVTEVAAAQPAVEPVPVPEPAPEPVLASSEPPVDPAPAAAPRTDPSRRSTTRKDASLLGRAFAWTGPQQSILTQRSDTPGPAADEPAE